jgi:hypothetical protein
MGGSLDIIGSYIIGGLVLVLMTGVIINFQEGAQQSTLNEISQVSMAQMTQTMDRSITSAIASRARKSCLSITSQSLSSQTTTMTASWIQSPTRWEEHGRAPPCRAVFPLQAAARCRGPHADPWYCSPGMTRREIGRRMPV